MAVNFKLLFEQTGKLVLVYFMELRGLYWQFSFNKNKIFSIKILPGHTIKLARKGDIAQIIYKNEVLVKYEKSFEYSTLKLFSQIVKQGDIIIDAGANAGLYSIFYSKLIGKGGRVYAFEPDLKTYSLLKENLQLNNCTNVETFNAALSNKEGFVEMVAYNPDSLKIKDGDAFKYMENVADIHAVVRPGFVNAYKLDDTKELNSLAKIDFIKIDVEGAELLVLEGAVQTILKYKPVIIFELSGNWAKRFKYKPYQVILLLYDLGYEMEEYDLEQWIAKPKL